MSIRKASLALAIAAVLPLAACDVEQTREGDLPEVEGGQLPEYDVDVDAPDVDVETDTAVIEVPDVDIDGEDDPGELR